MSLEKMSESSSQSEDLQEEVDWRGQTVVKEE